MLGGGAGDGSDLLKVERENSAPVLISREATDVEKVNNYQLFYLNGIRKWDRIPIMTTVWL